MEEAREDAGEEVREDAEEEVGKDTRVEVREEAGKEVRLNANGEVMDKDDEDVRENLAEMNHSEKKSIKRKRTGTHCSSRQQRVDLPFLCPSCRECSYATDFGLKIHMNRFCKARKREEQL